ncbi:tripartite-type tricarboxylate transporter receptor subunit TctC [Sphingomonas vulcanisoli]|uniref:Tripartite-type tricarboxylate transporter receptor subunit TctC n=1 Tax=Sphingomonas vulcanisoli TaxID=1658060 RepID=A0ABX0TUM4_9SPHN|nr:tripartite tricarboxylate transporter substrate-binding protein [Sphingomonas vulcanisoli]NIJ09233.1 tripartite-type tricarboxylate transporter receptor subunit TctC [Sphingomonas vulcanisoli]
MGDSIKLLVPDSPGGIDDLSARLVSRHLGRFIEGSPTIVVDYEPVGGGIALANGFAANAPRDGSVIAVVQRSVPQLAIEGHPEVTFDPLAFTWLGSLSSFAEDAYMVLVNVDYPAYTAEDLKTLATPARFGAVGISSTNYTIAAIAKSLFGYRLDISTEYTGAASIFKAMQAGELDGQVVGINSIRANQPALWEGKKVRPLVQFGRQTRHPILPDVPTGRELTSDPIELAVIDFAELPFRMALPFMAPPGVPAERAKMLQDGFTRMMADPDFLADAEQIKLDISPVSGEGIKQLIQTAAQTPPEVIARYRAMVAPNT